MSNTPKYITDLEQRMDKMGDNIDKCHEFYKEMRDNHDSQCEVNAEVLTKVNLIMDCLKGNELNTNNGGLVDKVNNNTKEIGKLNNRLAKREGVLVTLTIIITAAISSFVGWLFNK